MSLTAPNPSPVELEAQPDIQGGVLARVLTLTSVVIRRPTPGLPIHATWRSLGLDSLDLLDLVVECEQEFDIAIPDSVMVGLHTPGDLATFIARTQSGA